MATKKGKPSMSFSSMLWRFLYLLISYFLLAYITTISDELFIPFTIFIGGIMYDYFSLGSNAGRDEELKKIANKGLKCAIPFIIIGLLGVFRIICIKQVIILGFPTPFITLPFLAKSSISIRNYIGIPYLLLWLLGWIVPGIEIRNLWRNLYRNNIFEVSSKSNTTTNINTPA